jgi:hypothetical protein
MPNSCHKCQGLLLRVEMKEPASANIPMLQRKTSVTQLYKRLSMCDTCSEKRYNDQPQGVFVRPNRTRLNSMPVVGTKRSASREFIRIRKTSASPAVLSS